MLRAGVEQSVGAGTLAAALRPVPVPPTESAQDRQFSKCKRRRSSVADEPRSPEKQLSSAEVNAALATALHKDRGLQAVEGQLDAQQAALQQVGAAMEQQAAALPLARFPSMYAMWVVISPTSGRRMRWDSL